MQKTLFFLSRHSFCLIRAIQSVKTKGSENIKQIPGDWSL